MHRRTRLLAALAFSAIVLAPATAPVETARAAWRQTLTAGPVSPASAFDIPSSWSSYHSYAELVADIKAVAAAHPDIVSLRSIGKSYGGRDLWVAKVSDNVATDEAEPEVLFEGGTHALEHMGVEMTVKLLHTLVDGYGTDTWATRIVRGRETWILFNLNPDGSEYDISGSSFRNWRKNRQPNAGTTAVGTDLNRNWDYHWGCCGLVSSNPASVYYRGAAPFSAPEAAALRDFVASRVVDGREQIRTAIDFHESGRFVLWPYDWTTADVPADMTAQDHAALAAIGRAMGASNGYAAMQGSDMYTDSGSFTDWLYGRYRTFAYTVEMGIDVYRPNATLAAELKRNVSAALYLADRAACPYEVLGAATAIARCGAFDDDVEVPRGWTVNPDGTDTAPSAARWARGVPETTSVSGVTLQRTAVASGRYALVTGPAAGSSANAGDVDGTTTIRSAAIRLPATTGQRLAFRWLFAHAANASAADHLRAIVETADGTQTVVWERAGSATLVSGTWSSASVLLDAWTGQTIRLRFEAADLATASTVEAGIDDIRVTRPG